MSEKILEWDEKLQTNKQTNKQIQLHISAIKFCVLEKEQLWIKTFNQRTFPSSYLSAGTI